MEEGEGRGYMRIWSEITKKFEKWRDINMMKLYERADLDKIWNKGWELIVLCGVSCIVKT